jgi:hypothetical protein
MLTARQYGEVVLPDASTGQGPGTLARKLSRCKEGMACFLSSWYKFYWALRVSRRAPCERSEWRGYKFSRSYELIPGYKAIGGHRRSVAVQIISEPEIYQGTGFRLRADARVRVQESSRICLECRSESKNHDKQLTHIVCVMFRPVMKCHSQSLCSFDLNAVSTLQ